MTRSFEQWTLSFMLAVAMLVLGLTMYRASCVKSLRGQIETLQQENIMLRWRLTLYLADPETQSYLDRWFCSQAKRIANCGSFGRTVYINNLGWRTGTVDTTSAPSLKWIKSNAHLVAYKDTNGVWHFPQQGGKK